MQLHVTVHVLVPVHMFADHLQNYKTCPCLFFQLACPKQKHSSKCTSSWENCMSKLSPNYTLWLNIIPTQLNDN